MTENFRALIAILILSIPVLAYLRKPLTAYAIAPADYTLRASLWLLLTAVLFLSFSFWLFTLIAALVLVTIGRMDSNPLGLYCFLLFVAPPFQASIEGFGGINRFFEVDYLRLLSLVILLPVAAKLLGKPSTVRLFKLPSDKYLLAYLALQLISQAPTTSTTDLLRSVLTNFIDVFLPYYVFSRSLSDARQLRDTLASFAGVCALIAVLAVFEFFKGWLLYSSLPNFLNVHWGYGNYMQRDGALRATVSAGHSIVLGYVLTVGLGLHLALRHAYPSLRSWQAVLLLLAAGIVAALARGPWMGAAVMISIAVALAPNAPARFGKIGFAAVFVIPALMLTPYGPKIISLLPFVGDYDAGSVDYRQQLFTVSMGVLKQNPIFGSPYYMANEAMEQMRQGEGIIDMVNSYLGIALGTGLVGLGLFAGVFVSSLGRMWLHLTRLEDKDSDEHLIGRALLATVVGILTIIATASSINAIPVVYWCMAGACAAYVRWVKVESQLVSPGTALGAISSSRKLRYD